MTADFDSTNSTDSDSGVLVLAGTPIGDASYVSPALRDALGRADLIAAEDTRRFVDLCRRSGMSPQAPVMSFFEGNETERTPGLIERLQGGATVVLVTDAGMPSVSDPGFRVVDAAIAAGARVTAVPGPSAVLTALAVSGLATDRFCFEGFLPRKAGPRRTRLTKLATEDRTMVFFEAPHRVAAFLDDAVATLGAERKAALCRELTKTYEEVVRGTLADLARWAASEVRGEITIVVAGASPGTPDMTVLVAEAQGLIMAGEKRSVAVAGVASAHGVDRHQLYDAVLTAG